MNLTLIRPARWAALLAGLTLVVSVAAVQAQSADAPAMAVEVSGVASGDVITANEIAFTVQPVGYEFSAAHAGTPPLDGLGHYHLVLDGGLIDMVTTPEASLSLQNVPPGSHTLMIVPAMNNHMPVPEGAVAIDFDYQPETPLEPITAATAGAPSITIVSPAAGETLSGEFEMTISTTDFELSETLLGKPNLDGYGHWHVFIDAAEGMGTMAGMAGSDTFTLSTEALTSGPHTLIAVLVDNLHVPFDPPIAAAVNIEVAASDGTSAEPAADSSEVGVTLSEFAITPPEVTLAAGTVTFLGANGGSIDHALAIEGEGVTAATPDSSYSPGVTESFTVDLAPGTYKLYCPIPGHREAGMEATVTVS